MSDINSIFQSKNMVEIKTNNGTTAYKIKSDYWDSSDIFLVKKKDGSYSLAIDVVFDTKIQNRLGTNHGTYELMIDKNNVPYFTEDSLCTEDNFYMPEYGIAPEPRFPICDKDDRITKKSNSIFDYSGKCYDSKNNIDAVKYYFSNDYHTTMLRDETVALIYKIVHLPEMKAKIDKRLEITKNDVLDVKKALNDHLDAVINNEKGDSGRASELAETIVKMSCYGTALNPFKIIKLDLCDYNYLLKENNKKIENELIK